MFVIRVPGITKMDCLIIGRIHIPTQDPDPYPYQKDTDPKHFDWLYISPVNGFGLVA